MPKTKAKPTLIKRISRASRRNKLIVSLFVLASVGLGGLFIAKSIASSSPHDCVLRQYSYAPTKYYWCVAQLQNSLQIVHHYHSVVLSPGVDGYYGTNTRSAVYSFQRYARIGYDGVAGPQTWSYLCSSMSVSGNKELYGSTWYWRVRNALYNDGCP